MKRLRTAVACALLLVGTLGVLLTSRKGDSGDVDSHVGFVKGYSWGWTGTRGSYSGDAADQSLKLLSETGTEWISLAFAAHMKTRSSPNILYAHNNPLMVSDDEIRRAVGLARSHGFRVIMKPVVDCLDGAWRATIEPKTAEAWRQWWQSYEAFVLHYAKLAEATGCEMLCVGCEMRSTEHAGDRWQRLIEEVRKSYEGLTIYNVNHSDIEAVNWFDAVDIIGVSGYWPVSTEQDRSLARMLASWQPIREKLRRLSKKWDRPILFIEIGMRSARGCSTMPWDWQHENLPFDGQEQARYYEAALRSFWNEPWFVGFCWWDWKSQLYDREQATTNTDFCVFGKSAEDVLRSWYSKAR